MSTGLDYVVAMMAEELDRFAIVSPEVRRRVCGRLVEDSDFTFAAEDKYQLDKLLATSGELVEVAEAVNVRTVTLEMRLTAEEQTVLQVNNRDVRLLFEPGATYSHALAYAQRIIDTDRCLRSLNHASGLILDIGGNYAVHRRSGRNVHSCTLVASNRERHRQTERDVQMRAEGINDGRVNKCRDGALLCNVKAAQSMSVHTLPDIPYEDLPMILDVHDISYHVAVFHYDPMMLVSDTGTLEGSGMHYAIEGERVTFHFDMDSSRDYTHSWTNMRKYVVPWVQASLTSQYVYIYEIKNLAGGVLTAEIFRVSKMDVGLQLPRPLYAYTPREDRVSIKTWIYDVDSGLSPTLSEAYVPVEMMVYADMYRFLHMYGVSNDTANPNKPLTFAQFRDMGRTYNHVRKFGDTSITTKHKISALTEENVYLGIYAVVVHDRAVQQAKAQALTDVMLRKQRGHGRGAGLLALSLSVRAAAMPLMVLGRGFDFFLRKLAEKWKTYLSGSLLLSKADTVDSYTPLMPFDALGTRSTAATSELFAYPRLDTDAVKKDDIQDLFGETMSMKQIAVVASKDETNDHVYDKSVTFVDEGEYMMSGGLGSVSWEDDTASMTEVESDVKNLVAATLSVETKESGNTVEDTEKGHDVLEEEEYAQDYRVSKSEYLGRYNEMRRNLGLTSTKMAVVQEADLHIHAVASLLEYAIYSLDVGHGVLRNAVDIAMKCMPGSRPSPHAIRTYNNGYDVGVRFFRAVGGQVEDDAKSYAMAIDGVRKTPVVLRKVSRGKSVRVRQDCGEFIMVTDNLRVFNHFVIAKRVLGLVDSGYAPKFKMTLVDGVFGCGKTTEIVDDFTDDDVILSAGKHSSDDTLRRLLAKNKSVLSARLLADRVRTVDSSTIHGRRSVHGSVKRVFLDEGLMLFPGMLYAAVASYNPEEVRVYGDSVQITGIDRSPTLGALVFPGIVRWTSIERRMISQSAPADVCVILQQFYSEPIYTRNPVRRSIKVDVIPVLENPAYTTVRPNTMYVSVLQGDKKKLLATPGFVDGKKALESAVASGSKDFTLKPGSVFTVHEAQGQRFPNTCCVRMNPNTSAPLRSVPHFVVSLSRHYYKYNYVTCARDDMFYNYLSRFVSEAELDKVSKPPSEYMLSYIGKLKRGELS